MSVEVLYLDMLLNIDFEIDANVLYLDGLLAHVLQQQTTLVNTSFYGCPL